MQVRWNHAIILMKIVARRFPRIVSKKFAQVLNYNRVVLSLGLFGLLTVNLTPDTPVITLSPARKKFQAEKSCSVALNQWGTLLECSVVDPTEMLLGNV